MRGRATIKGTLLMAIALIALMAIALLDLMAVAVVRTTSDT